MSNLRFEDIQEVRIHPAIGVARLGDSPDGFFIGPEYPGRPAHPADGRFKDSAGRVKRQAARFRCFGFSRSAGQWIELTHGNGVEIKWTVDLVNKKACARYATSDDGYRNKSEDPGKPHDAASERRLTIRPGVMAISGHDRSVAGAEGTITFHDEQKGDKSAGVKLGDLRTDEKGHLLVLGGHGKAGSPHGDPVTGSFDSDGWWDDTSDGKVDATVTIGGRPVPVKSAWVLVGPPKFAPDLETVVTLWDKLTESPQPVHRDVPSYTRDIQPILRRAQSMRAVHQRAGENHTVWPEPLYGYYARRKIGSWVAETDTNKRMPLMAGPAYGGHLTANQLAAMTAWSEGRFERDWGKVTQPPAKITPEGLDQAALLACVGGSFNPGIEVSRYFFHPDNWAEPGTRDFRLSAKVGPGDVTARMCIPWQSDFYLCAGDWWPVPRPVAVKCEGRNKYETWTRDWVKDLPEMVDKWSKLGFVLADHNGHYREVERERYQYRPAPPLSGTQWTGAEGPGAVADSETGPQAVPEQLADLELALYGRGELPPGEEHVWPLLLTEEDRSVEIQVHGAAPQALSVRVITPQAIEVAEDDTRLTGVRTEDALTLQIALPVEILPERFADHGRWEIRVSAPGATAPVPYRLAVAAESDIRIGEPAVTLDAAGALTVTTSLGDREIREAAAVLPQGGTELPLQQLSGPGELGAAGAPEAAERIVRLRVAGVSRMGNPFVRERFLRTGAGR